MADLMNYLRKLAGGTSDSNGEGITDSSPPSCLSVSERLRCCIVAFKVMRSNLDALNVDLQDFFIQLYNLILEYRPGRFVFINYNIILVFYKFKNQLLIKKIKDL